MSSRDRRNHKEKDICLMGRIMFCNGKRYSILSSISFYREIVMNTNVLIDLLLRNSDIPGLHSQRPRNGVIRQLKMTVRQQRDDRQLLLTKLRMKLR